MGKMGQMALEIDECTQILDELLEDLDKMYLSLNSDLFKNEHKDLKYYINIIKENLIDNSDLCYFVEHSIIIECLDVKNFNSSIEKSEKSEKYVCANIIYEELLSKIRNLDFIRNIDVDSGNNNTIGFLSRNINDLEKEKRELNSEIKSLTSQSDLQNNDVVDKKKELKLKLENEIQELRYKIKVKKNENDAEEHWRGKVKSIFKDLSLHIEPMVKEKKRLNMMFIFYASLVVILLLLILVIVFLISSKLKDLEDVPKLNEYLEIIFPLPIVGLLLWGFIAQMNRAQRQLIVLTRSIHKIQYIEGLILSINYLSKNIKDRVSRINAALDRLIENHLNGSDVESEVGLLKEENKDSLPFNSVLKLIKECKDLSKK